MFHEIYTFLNKIYTTVLLRLWFTDHTMDDFESRLIELGCSKTNTHNSVVFTTPNGKGKIEITDSEILVNPK